MSEQSPESGQPTSEHLPEPVTPPVSNPPAVTTPTPVRAGATSSSAIIALVLAIASWVSCPVVLAIVALVFASKADREIAGQGVGGGGLATSAKIVAWINIGVSLAFVVVGVFVLLLAVASGSWS